MSTLLPTHDTSKLEPFHTFRFLADNIFNFMAVIILTISSNYIIIIYYVFFTHKYNIYPSSYLYGVTDMTISHYFL